MYSWSQSLCPWLFLACICFLIQMPCNVRCLNIPGSRNWVPVPFHLDPALCFFVGSAWPSPSCLFLREVEAAVSVLLSREKPGIQVYHFLSKYSTRVLCKMPWLWIKTWHALRLLKAYQINQTLQEGQLVCKSQTAFVDREVLRLSAQLGFFRNLVQNPFVSSVFITPWAVRQSIRVRHSGWGAFQLLACPVHLQQLGPRARFLSEVLCPESRSGVRAGAELALFEDGSLAACRTRWIRIRHRRLVNVSTGRAKQIPGLLARSKAASERKGEKKVIEKIKKLILKELCEHKWVVWIQLWKEIAF